MLLSTLLKYPALSTVGISAVIIALAVVLSVISYLTLGVKDPGLAYEAFSALGIASLLAPTFLYPWIRTAVKLREATVEIGKLATTDALTGLPNTFVLRERLASAIEGVSRAGQFAVLFIDLDQFKLINDTLGHPRGDALLVAAAGRLRQTVRESDLVTRFGGDEFVVIQSPLASAGEASELAGRIVEALSAAYKIDGHEIMIGASVGIAIAPADGVGTDQLLKNADLALYRAKAHGKRTWRFFEPAMAAATQARRNLELDLRWALANGAFEIYYQPILNLRSGRISACEALIRWRDHTGKMKAPADFIPIAEEMGIIGEIGDWVLREACAECSTWPSGIRVAVNFSTVQFRLANMVDAITRALAHARLSPDRLEVEITETLLMQDFPATRTTIEELRKLGVRIALDDFGTGYSGLSYLHSFPLDKVKIDRSFLAGLPADERSLTLLRGLAGLSAALGITVAVEGIETAGQLTAVSAEDCIDEAQGFLFSVPLPQRQIREFLMTRALDGSDARDMLKIMPREHPRLRIA